MNWDNPLSSIDDEQWLNNYDFVEEKEPLETYLINNSDN